MKIKKVSTETEVFELTKDELVHASAKVAEKLSRKADDFELGLLVSSIAAAIIAEIVEGAKEE